MNDRSAQEAGGAESQSGIRRPVCANRPRVVIIMVGERSRGFWA